MIAIISPVSSMRRRGAAGGKEREKEKIRNLGSKEGVTSLPRVVKI